MKRITSVGLAVALLGLASAGARAQHAEPPLKELPPASAAAPDPFAAPFFNPSGTASAPAAQPAPPVPKGSLFDAATAGAPVVPARPVTPNDLQPPMFDEVFGDTPDTPGWISAELLIGRGRSPSLIPVVTTGAGDTTTAGFVGQPNTVPLFGGRRVLTDWRAGLRVEYGFWFDDTRRLGISGRFYSLFSNEDSIFVAGSPASAINVPQFIPATATAAGTQFPVYVSFPGTTTGNVSAVAHTSFFGFDANMRWTLGLGDSYRVDLLGGYRQMQLHDSLGVSFNQVGLAGNPALAPRLSGSDRIHTANDFYGPQVGLFTAAGRGRFTLEAHGALALGVTASDLEFTRRRTAGFGAAAGVPTDPATLAALAALGLPAGTATNSIPLVNTSQSGRLTYFGLVGEGGARLAWYPTEHIRMMVGYTFLYWNNVRRAQEMYLGAPVLRPRAIDFSTHLFSLGLEVRY